MVEVVNGDHTAIEAAATEAGARITDRAHARVLLEITADPSRVDAFVDAMRRFDLKQLARTGPIVIREADPAVGSSDPIADASVGAPSLTQSAHTPQESVR